MKSALSPVAIDTAPFETIAFSLYVIPMDTLSIVFVVLALVIGTDAFVGKRKALSRAALVALALAGTARYAFHSPLAMALLLLACLIQGATTVLNLTASWRALQAVSRKNTIMQVQAAVPVGYRLLDADTERYGMLQPGDLVLNEELCTFVAPEDGSSPLVHKHPAVARPEPVTPERAQ